MSDMLLLNLDLERWPSNPSKPKAYMPKGDEIRKRSRHDYSELIKSVGIHMDYSGKRCLIYKTSQSI